MPYKLKDPVRHKFTKNNYNNRDWKTYEEGLRNRGSLTVWFSEEAILAWNPPIDKKRKRGRQRRYSDLAIETCHTLRLVYKTGLRQTEGFLASILQLMKLDLSVPDHSTLSRRGKTVSLRKKACKKPLPEKGSVIVIVDSTGLKVFGEKEWMNHKHGTKQRKVWRKLHMCIDEDGEILSSTLTSHTTSDTSQVDELLKGVEAPIDALIGDGGYDNAPTYKALDEHQKRHNRAQKSQATIPPNTGFQAENETDAQQRLENIRMIEDKGKHLWQTQMDYGRRARVENTMHRYKSIIGNKLRSRTFESQLTETRIAVQIVNRMAELGMPRAKIAA